MTSLARVELWGRTIGAVALDSADGVARFEYEPEFVESGIELSPLVMPLARRIWSFPELPPATFSGLPGLLSDSLPDKFGRALIDVWLASQGRAPGSFDAVERLCYVGRRGMGALEFVPAFGPRATAARKLEVDRLVALVSEILSDRASFVASLDTSRRKQALAEILRVGTSAGGARAKAVIAWNPLTQEVRSGQLDAGPGFEHWLLKFDGVAANRDREATDPRGFGAIEFAYFLMARAAGIRMSDCRLLEEGGRRHFMTRRFDRLDGGGRLHVQSLGALAHFDFNRPGAHSYEQALAIIRRLGLSVSDLEEQFRRMVFNVLARNQDDHVKNIAFLMDRRGEWSLAPAFDVGYAFNPSGDWTARHQMSIHGKTDGFVLEDFDACARTASLGRGRAKEIVAEVRSVVLRWPEFAAEARLPEATTVEIGSHLRLDLK